MDRKKLDNTNKRRFISNVVMFDIDRDRKLKEKYTQRALEKERPDKEKTERDIRMAVEESKRHISLTIIESIKNMKNQIIEFIKKS